MMAYIGTEGYIINFELCEGKQYCQNGTVEFLQETVSLCRRLTDSPLLVRPDSRNDSIDNVAVLIDTGCFFIIKRNLRRERRDGWFEMAIQYCQDISSPVTRKPYTSAVIGRAFPASTSTGISRFAPAMRSRNAPLINMGSSISFRK